MSKLFLYRLFKQSKIFFLFSLLFILVYIVVLNKKMDMLFFPINSMFTEENKSALSTSTFAVKVNNNIVKITDDAYLKKDFSENSLQTFAKWIITDRKDFMSNLLERKFVNTAQRTFYTNYLTPPQNTLSTWPVWFVKFHDVQIEVGDAIEIWQYNFVISNNTLVLKDSFLINKQNAINE